MSELGPFRRSFEIHEDLPRDGVPWEPPVVLMTARWPVAGEPDEAVIAEAAFAYLEQAIVTGRLPAAMAASLLARVSALVADIHQAVAPPARARA